jgi:hypothetical protein
MLPFCLIAACECGKSAELYETQFGEHTAAAQPAYR